MTGSSFRRPEVDRFIRDAKARYAHRLEFECLRGEEFPQSVPPPDPSRELAAQSVAGDDSPSECRTVPLATLRPPLSPLTLSDPQKTLSDPPERHSVAPPTAAGQCDEGPRWIAPPEDEIHLPELDEPEFFIRQAVERTHGEFEAARDAHEWKTPGFLLAQRLRGHAGLADLSSWDAAERVEVAFGAEAGSAAWSQALGNEDSLGNPTDPLGDFVEAWDRIERPCSRNLFHDACELARRYPLRPPRAVPPGYVQILSVAWHLARLREGTFALSSRQAAEAGGFSHHAPAARWLRIAQRQGLLELVEEGGKGPSSRKAATYRFIMEAVEESQE